MSNHVKSAALVLVAVCAVFGGACADNVDPADSSSANGGSTTGVDELAARLCPRSCPTAKTCADTYSAWFDQQACEAQCQRELGGTGYFNAEFAPLFFETMSKLEVDPSCLTTRFLDPWRPPYLPQVLEPDVLQRCVDARLECIDDVDGTTGVCYQVYYVFNQAQRAAVEPCLDVPCISYNACLCNTMLAGAPWVAIPLIEDPSLPTCPP